MPADLQTPKAQRALQICLWAALFAAVGLRISFGGRGLDFTDEGFSLLASAHPAEMRVWPSLFFDFTGPLFALAGGDIATMRHLGLALLLAASWALALGVARWLREEEAAPGAVSLFPVMAMGSLINYTYGMSIPTYDLITPWGLSMGLGLLLVALAPGGGPGRLALVGAGFALAVAAASKPPAILALGVALIWVFTARRSVRSVFWLLLGVAVAGLPPLAVHSPREIYEVLSSGLQFHLLSGAGYAPGAALGRYAIQTAQAVGQTATYAALPLLTALVCRRFRPRVVASLLPVVVLLFVLYFQDALLGGRSAARGGQTTAGVLSAILVCAGPGRDLLTRMFRRDRWPILLIALALPFVGALGTAKNLSAALAFYMLPWFVLAPICMSNSGYGAAERLLRCAVPALLAAFASTTAPFTSPYGLTAPFVEQTVPITMGQPPTSLLTDRQTARFLGRLQAAARECGFSPGQDIIGLLEMPGFVFALGGVSPATSFFPRDGSGVREAISFALSHVPEARLKRSFVLLNDHVLRVGGFVIAGYRVPEDYDVCFDRDGPSKYGNMRVRLLRPRTLTPDR